MSINFNKKGFKRKYKLLKLGKEKYTLRVSLFSSLLFAVTMLAFNYFLQDEKSIKSLVFLFLFSFVFMFVFNYLINKSQWSQIKREHNETLDYWEKHDPSFFDGEKYEKIE